MKLKQRCAVVVVTVIGILSLMGTAAAQSDIESHASCSYCGMDRGMFGHSRMLLTYEDGSEVGTCSIHCAAVHLAVTINKVPGSIQVADYNTRALIDAEGAVWVIGGKLPGVMTQRAKWAFSDSAGADAFTKENGGEKADFDGAMEATYEDMYQDILMIREKRKMMDM